MKQINAQCCIIGGVLICLIAWGLVLAMIVDFLADSLIISFLAYGLTIAGIFTGYLGIFNLWIKGKEKRELNNLREKMKDNQMGPYQMEFEADSEDFQEFLEKEQGRNSKK